jgi:heme exporter protein A
VEENLASRLQCEALHLWRGEHHVLRGVQLSVSAGEVLQITGANGSGKTSLLRTLCGLMQPDEGRVLWDERDVRQDWPAYWSSLAYLGHEPPLKGELSGRENLQFWIGVRRRLDSRALDAALQRVGAGAWKERLVRTLSAGQRRRVALAGLALLEVPIWLLDEPTTNLDAAGRELVGHLIEAQCDRGGLVIAAVHQDLPIHPGRLRQLELAA